MNIPVVAIDGPSASGKGTIAQRVAQKLGFHYLESGALYRVIALISLREQTMAESRLAGIAASMELRFVDGKIYSQNHDVTDDLRSEAVGNRASEIAKMATDLFGEAWRGFLAKLCQGGATALEGLAGGSEGRQFFFKLGPSFPLNFSHKSFLAKQLSFQNFPPLSDVSRDARPNRF